MLSCLKKDINIIFKKMLENIVVIWLEYKMALYNFFFCSLKSPYSMSCDKP